MTTIISKAVTIGIGARAVTIYANQIEKQYAKKLIIIDAPNPKSKAEDGPKSTLLVDRQKRILKLIIRGYIEYTDEEKLVESFEIGTSDSRNINIKITTTVEIPPAAPTSTDENFSANMEKMGLTWGGKSGEQEEISAMISAIVGEDK